MLVPKTEAGHGKTRKSNLELLKNAVGTPICDSSPNKTIQPEKIHYIYYDAIAILISAIIIVNEHNTI